MPGAPVITTAGALGIIMAAGAAGVLVLAAGILFVVGQTGALPRTRDAMAIMMAIGGVVLVVVMAMWPEMPADPVLVTPTTYGPPPDPLAGYDSSELP
jgi:hypothetical protein